jgi:hypothetical protein
VRFDPHCTRHKGILYLIGPGSNIVITSPAMSMVLLMTAVDGPSKLMCERREIISPEPKTQGSAGALVLRSAGSCQ